jgi:hypothetical protein
MATTAKYQCFPLAGQRDFLRLLAPYLPEDITVFHPRTGRYGLLRGLPGCYEGQQEPLADVEFYADSEARAEGCGDITEPIAKILPVLYGFEDLDKWVLDAKGKNTLVMEELIASLYAGPVDVFKTVYHSATSVTGKLLEWWVIDFATHEGTGCEATFRSDGAAEIESRPVNAAPLLHQYHFAVGLAPNQYHRRQPGFDYASGAKPFTYLTLGEPLPKVTPCPSKRADCPSGCPKCPTDEPGECSICTRVTNGAKYCDDCQRAGAGKEVNHAA